VDMLASAPPDHYQRTVDTVLADDNVDAVVVIFIPPPVTDADDDAAAITRASASMPTKPIAGVFMRSAAAPDALAAIPCFSFPEPAAIALARIAAYAEWRAEKPGQPAIPADLQPGLARLVIERALQ